MTLSALLLLTLSVACSAPGTGSEQESPTAAPAGTGFVRTESVDEGQAVAIPAAQASSDAAIEEGTIGLSAKTTRGHVWAEPAIDGDEVALLLPVVTLGDHVHFEMVGGDAPVGFVGYFSDGSFFARASVCPSCGAERVEWGGSLVVCRSCEAKFDAVTGAVEAGARGYPEGVVPCGLGDGFITMSLSDLVEAHARTVAGEATLFELPEPVEDEDRGDRSWPRCCTT
ncbi:MAG: hypothetical protein E4G93_03450 [Dehalococcoidia bacterium]|nr:MAG: hypothetical protein E4G93_03450 [Dehalococcoidia bacterium]